MVQAARERDVDRAGALHVGVVHPALVDEAKDVFERPVLAGGCDRADGMYVTGTDRAPQELQLFGETSVSDDHRVEVRGVDQRERSQKVVHAFGRDQLAHVPHAPSGSVGVRFRLEEVDVASGIDDGRAREPSRHDAVSSFDHVPAAAHDDGCRVQPLRCKRDVALLHLDCVFECASVELR